MVTGFNVNVHHAGKVYHVQTEDRGRKHPIIETLVYQGGKILHQENLSYADKNDEGIYDEKEVGRLVDLQHRRTIDAIKSGKFEIQRPFGEEFITNRTFDECVFDYLVEQGKKESLQLEVVSRSEFRPGTAGSIVVRAIRRGTSDPVAGAKLEVRILRSSGGPKPLPALKTDARGEARIEFSVPPDAGTAAVIIQGESDCGHDEIQQLLR